MTSALDMTRRLTRAVLGAGAVGTLAVTGHLALAHASTTRSSGGPVQSTQGRSVPGTSARPTQPQQGQSQRQRGSGSGFGQTPGLQGGSSSGGGSTTTHGS
jgi:hypothetical protein